MANNANKVFVGKPLVTGGIFVAPLGSTLPEDTTTALDAAFQPVGYVTDDGLTKTVNRDSNRILAWGGDIIAATQKSFTAEFKFKMAEYLNALPQTLLWGEENVTSATATGIDTISVAVTSAAPPHNIWVVEMKQGTGRLRLVIPDGIITDTGDVVYKDDDVASLEVTVTAFADPDAHFWYEYSTSPTPAASGTLAAPEAAAAKSK